MHHARCAGGISVRASPAVASILVPLFRKEKQGIADSAVPTGAQA